jgi:uncharacterized protein YggE
VKYYFFILLVNLYSFPLIASEFSGIEVTGKASILVMPDKFSLTVMVQERGRSATKTKQLVDSKSKRIVNMLIASGISEENIASSQLRLYPRYEQPSIMLNNAELQTKLSSDQRIKHGLKNTPSKTVTLVNFDISRTIVITFSDMIIYDKLLDQMVKLGVSNISPLEMSFVESKKYYKQALSLAIANAKEKALQMAEHAGVKLGPLSAMKEQSYHAPSSYQMMRSEGANFQSQVGKKTIKAQVIATFSIEP